MQSGLCPSWLSALNSMGTPIPRAVLLGAPIPPYLTIFMILAWVRRCLWWSPTQPIPSGVTHPTHSFWRSPIQHIFGGHPPNPIPFGVSHYEDISLRAEGTPFSMSCPLKAGMKSAHQCFYDIRAPMKGLSKDSLHSGTDISTVEITHPQKG